MADADSARPLNKGLGEETHRASRPVRTAGWVALLLVAFALNAAGLYVAFTSRGHFIIWDIHPTLVAARAVREGQDPYSPEVTATIQREVYGRLARPGEDVQAFAYPAYVAYLAIPLTLLPLPWAQAIWLSLIECSVVAGVALIADWLGWPRRAGTRMLMFAVCGLYYPVVWGFVLGQPAMIVFSFLALATWAAARGHDRLAGVALGLTIIKPTVVSLLFPGVAVWAIARRRWRILGGATVVAGSLVVLPTLFLPEWITGFARRLSEYASYSPFTAPALLVVERCCRAAAGWLVPLVIAAILGLVAHGWWIAARDGREGDFLWAAGITLIATTLMAPRISTANQVILLLPILAVGKALSAKGWVGAVLALGAAMAWGVGPWVLSWIPPVSTAQPRYPVEHRILSPIVPITLGGLWVILRRALSGVEATFHVAHRLRRMRNGGGGK